MLTSAVVLFVVVFGLKTGAWAITGVMALLAEGLHTLSDIFVTSFLLLALWASKKRADHVTQRRLPRSIGVASQILGDASHPPVRERPDPLGRFAP